MNQQSPEELLAKIANAKLIGRGGSGYSTATKWKEMFEKHHTELYMAVNGSEGEPGTQKDGYILEHHLTNLLEGILAAYTIFPQTKTIYLYLRKDYFETYNEKIKQELTHKYPTLPVVVFKEPGGYLCGENTVLVNAIEGRRLEPRRKPPYISEVGLFGQPTIINNLETFYQIGQIANNVYDDTRMYSITGDIPHSGVFAASTTISLSDLLKQTHNDIPHSFVQLGGGASGIYVTEDEFATTPANRGTGAVLVYDNTKHTLMELLKVKFTFLINENCGKCTPCREGLFRLHEMVTTNTWDETRATDIASALSKTSFCGLGLGAGMALTSLLEKRTRIWKQ
ncbi:MAG: NADH-ubiquinone oxidoreductase-F iron-sulfur binding region domain-containing protein [Microgenomates group bacterium]